MNAFLTHGGRLDEACTHFGGDPADWLDLSTGINPCPWPGAEAIRPAWRTLPDVRTLRRLEETAAACFGADPALCCAVPGSEAGLRALGCILGLPARHVPLTYGTYAKAFASPPPGHSGPTVLIVTNPNNPDGRLHQRDHLASALEQQQPGGGWLVADEAFADCHPEASMAGLVTNERNLAVTRSFGKFFGLAGVRLGFVLAPEPLLTQLRRLLGDWPVCSAALAFGVEAYADARWIAATRARLPERAARLDAVLERHGLRPTGACPLFRLATVPDAAGLFASLANAQILTRPFAHYPRLLRFGLPADDAQLARLDAALALWSAHG
ncbi:threonine-phosphate decarboxylase [Novosphingobium mangrovi (ex Huang et al. 2023)]|uniref:Pyridoxal phosphate-dependent class II aminotransferase n=1 Tax=Novosphingobium mangrovi (ex Huang et al. 2023) TaxID=2976432 RepID=A0ABT2I9D6_9SPHN|nr:threonine-phosphate decarboxylase [Novosphingobium mangrovi (ex Huang et al. 2023)]MCT2401422.1 pyridoxal phosphate-dependent class II aminotransferase [Novosphingobium mangrovi (ex Huang et al. 2023)]